LLRSEKKRKGKGFALNKKDKDNGKRPLVVRKEKSKETILEKMREDKRPDRKASGGGKGLRRL